jgi:hypothetical protein
MELLLGLIGLFMLYSWGHFIVMDFQKFYGNRTSYEKVITWVAIITLVLYILGTLMD